MENFIEFWTEALSEKSGQKLEKIKYLYVLMLECGSVYIGITENPKNRKSQHQTKRGKTFEMKILDTIKTREELSKEERAIIDYKILGYNVLNKRMGGI